VNPLALDSCREVEITYALGLHLRVANSFVRVANRFRAEVRVSHEGREADGKSSWT